MTRRKSATLADLSAETGLSVQTVSKALRGLPGMSEETRGRIVTTALRIGYLTVDQARELASRGIAAYPSFRRRFALVLSGLSLNHNKLLMQGLTERFSRMDHAIEAIVLDEELSDAAFAEWADVHNLSTSDGLFLAPRLTSRRIEKKLLQLDIPKIWINYPPPGTLADSVVWDVYEAVCQSVLHLTGIGHHRIMYVGETGGQRGFLYRWQAFQEMMAEAGLPVVPAHHAAGETVAEGEFERLFRQHAPSAVIVGIDERLPEVLRIFGRLGVRVPDDCSLVALLNEPSAARADISRPELLIKETAYQAAEKILWRIANPGAPFEHLRIAGRFIPGKTAAPLAGARQSH